MKKKKKVVAKKHSTPADKISTAICVVLILAVLGLGVWATWKPIKNALKANTDTSTTDTSTDSSQDQQQEATVKTVLDQMGITMDDLKNDYGVDTSKLTEDSSTGDLFDNMTVENFYKLNKASYEKSKPADDADDETKSQYEEAASTYESLDSFIQAMGVDKSEITDGMTATQFQELVSQKQQAAQAASGSTDGSADSTASTEEQSDTSEPAPQLAD